MISDDLFFVFRLNIQYWERFPLSDGVIERRMRYFTSKKRQKKNKHEKIFKARQVTFIFSWLYFLALIICASDTMGLLQNDELFSSDGDVANKDNNGKKE